MTLEERILYIARELTGVALVQMGFTLEYPYTDYQCIGDFASTEREFVNGCDRVKLEIKVTVTRPPVADTYGGE